MSSSCGQQATRGDGTIGSGSDDGSGGGGTGSVACTAETFTDPEGDADWSVVEGASPQSEPALDITSAWFTDAPSDAKDVTFHWTVSDLPDRRHPGPGGVLRLQLHLRVPDADHAPSACVHTVGASTDGGSNTAPTASFTYDPEKPRTGETVTFDASGSTDPDGDTLTYTWDLGDGTTADGETATHAYTDPGRYTVTLTVDDGGGGTDTATDHVVVRGGGDQQPERSEDADTNGPDAASVGGDATLASAVTTPAGGGALGLAMLALAGIAYRVLRRLV